LQSLLADPEGLQGREAAAALYEQLLGPFAAELARTEQLYIAPDGVLNLISFAALRGPDGRRLAETRDVRLVQTGRDLLRQEADRPARGLLALGAIDFGPTPAGQAAGATIRGEAVLPGIDLAALVSRTRETLRAGFQPLPGAAEEVRRIAWFYREMRPDEAVDVWQGAEASEARLRGLERPPRVLHLATHGFYRAAATRQERPMVLAGVALAGANQTLLEPHREGVLYAIEAQGLNLEGTELVVLSACEAGLATVRPGDEGLGLTAGLLHLGTRSVLAGVASLGRRPRSGGFHVASADLPKH
jgi:CHAT domain-containing protein